MSLTYQNFIKEVLLPRMKRNKKYIFVSTSELAEYESFLQPQERIWITKKGERGGLKFKDKIVTPHVSLLTFEEGKRLLKKLNADNKFKTPK